MALQIEIFSMKLIERRHILTSATLAQREPLTAQEFLLTFPSSNPCQDSSNLKQTWHMHEIWLLQAAPHADLIVLMQLAKAPIEHKPPPSLLLILSHSTTPSSMGSLPQEKQ